MATFSKMTLVVTGVTVGDKAISGTLALVTKLAGSVKAMALFVGVSIADTPRDDVVDDVDADVALIEMFGASFSGTSLTCSSVSDRTTLSSMGKFGLLIVAVVSEI